MWLTRKFCNRIFSYSVLSVIYQSYGALYSRQTFLWKKTLGILLLTIVDILGMGILDCGSLIKAFLLIFNPATKA
ncbi:MAG TPA: hypothetical protein DCM38_02555 [Gammaproteobacteria bacterium]|nr:hypothetical protein [Gammaproteobacteria bacterium]